MEEFLGKKKGEFPYMLQADPFFFSLLYEL